RVQRGGADQLSGVRRTAGVACGKSCRPAPSLEWAAEAARASTANKVPHGVGEARSKKTQGRQRHKDEQHEDQRYHNRPAFLTTSPPAHRASPAPFALRDK